VGQPRTRWEDYIEDLGWRSLGLQPTEMLEVVADRNVLRLNLELRPSNPHGHKRALKEGEDEDGDSYIVSTINHFHFSDYRLIVKSHRDFINQCYTFDVLLSIRNFSLRSVERKFAK